MRRLSELRLRRAGAHPDLRLIEPLERDEEGNVTPVDAITVDRIRELIEFTQLSTHRQRAKVAVIAPAEAMNAAAANALLKTLEEPPPDTYLMLVSHQPGRLPATIVSRCRRLPAPEPEPRAAAAWLGRAGRGERGAAAGAGRRRAAAGARARRSDGAARARVPARRARAAGATVAGRDRRPPRRVREGRAQDACSATGVLAD